jgi:hypothetical protein
VIQDIFEFFEKQFGKFVHKVAKIWKKKMYGFVLMREILAEHKVFCQDLRSFGQKAGPGQSIICVLGLFLRASYLGNNGGARSSLGFYYFKTLFLCKLLSMCLLGYTF